MRKSNFGKKNPLKKLTKKAKVTVAGVIGIVLLGAAIGFFSYYKVDSVEVRGTTHYTEDEIKKMVLKGSFASNSVLAPLFCGNVDTSDVAFVDAFKITQLNRNTICTVPYFDGIEVSKVVMDEKLDIKGDTVLNTAVALSTIFQKNDLVPDHIQFDSSYSISLIYGDITVQLGKDENLEEKMNRVAAILPKITGKKGILHMESVSTDTNTFEEEKEKTDTTSTSENWTGGYDENGDYTGDGEYDENGNYVGAKPMTALEEAIANWTGGYDGEGDYTGAGEYDANGNYVGPKPTQESLDAASENTDTTDTEDTGSDTQSGDYSDGYSEDNSQEYDSSYSGDYSDYSDGYSDSYNEDYSDSYSDGYNGDYYSEDYGY